MAADVPDPLIDRAIARLEAFNPAGALDALLASWRATPRAEVADRIDVLNAWLAPARPPLDGATISARRDAWLVRAGRGDAVDQWVLARHLAVRPHTHVHERLKWLVTQPPDPRWTAPLVLAMRENLLAPEQSRSTSRSARFAMDVLRKSRDRRALSLFEAHLKGLDVEYWFESLERHLPTEAPPLPAAQRAALDAALDTATDRAPPPAERLVDETGRRTEAQILEMIYAAPDDIDARSVYADWLEAQGSPRAEFLRLQIKRVRGRFLKKDAKREAALLKQHGLGWMGALGPVVREPDWHLGLPTAGNVVFRSRKQRDAMLLDPAWRTFTTVHVKDPAILTHPNLSRIEQLGRVTPFLAEKARALPMEPTTLADLPHALACTRLVVFADTVPYLPWDRLPSVDTLDVIQRHHLFADSLDALLALSERPWARLTLWNVPPLLGARVMQALPRVQRFEVGHWDARIGLTRAPDGHHVDVVATEYAPDFGEALQIANFLEPRSVRIHTLGKRRPAPVLDAWRGMLTARTVELPRARRGT